MKRAVRKYFKVRIEDCASIANELLERGIGIVDKRKFIESSASNYIGIRQEMDLKKALISVLAQHHVRKKG